MKIELIDENELIERYNDMLDEVGECKIGDYIYEPSRVLEELDPIAYNCGLTDYESSLEEEGTYSERSHNEEDFFKCPECGDLFDDEDEAKECCDTGDSEDETKE